MEFRPNQIPAYEAGMQFFKQKKPKPSLIVAPVAFGKSIVISKLAHDINEPVLVLQPSKELLEQNYGKLLLLGGTASIYSASMGIKELGEINYATIGSIKSLGQTFKELGIKKCIIDEADRYPRESDGMLRTFINSAGINHILGFTATPLKLQTNSDINGNSYSRLMMLTSRSGKGNFFKEILHVSQVEEMMRLGFWSKLEYLTYAYDESQLVYNTTGAEFTYKSMKIAYDEMQIRAKIIEFVAQSDRKSILIAVPSVADAIDLAQNIPNAAAVYGDMDKKERKRIIEGFKNLSIRVVINVNVLTVGFDHPRLDCLIGGRPTASLSWYYQFLGRGTRIDPDKKDCLIVDFAGNVARFGKIEELYYKYDGTHWKLYGEGGKLLTGIPMDEIGQHLEGDQVVFNFGKYEGKPVSSAPINYLNWLLREFTFTAKNNHIKQEIKRLKSLEK